MASPKNLTKDDVVKAGLDVINAGEKISTAASEFPSAELGENLEDLADNRKSFRNLFKGKTSVNAGTYGSSSIIGKASKNLFEFPVFMSSSIPLDYATATNTLLEQIYASYLQMAISMNPVVDKRDVEKGRVFQHFKTDTTKFLEYTDMWYSHDACHNVLINDDGVVTEFEMVGVPDRVANIILESANYVPLSEFDHFFQESSTSKLRKAVKDYEDTLKDLEDEKAALRDDQNTGVIDQAGLERLSRIDKEIRDARNDLQAARRDLHNVGSSRAQAARDNARDEYQKKRDTERDEYQKKRDDARDEYLKERDTARDKYLKDRDTARDNYQRERDEKTDAYQKTRDEKHDARDDAESIRQKERHTKDMMVKAPQLLDETKIQKLNSMKPLMMTANIRVKSGDTISDNVEYLLGVRTHCRLIKADILPEVAEYPLKQMNKLTQRAKWRAGEIKFLDYLFSRPEKKQAAYDSRDPNKKWYHRLYTLAHSKGSKWTAAKISGTGAANGLIPNATIVITKSDVDMVEAATKIDLLKPGTAKRFCSELYLIAFIVIDTDAQSIKILMPDINNDFEIHSMSSLNKQLATLDVSGDVARNAMKTIMR